MTRNRATVILVLMMLTMLSEATMATVQCSVQAGDPGMITVTVTVDMGDPDIDAVLPPLEVNATTLGADCTPDNLPYTSCVWTATQDAPGPSSVTAFFSQDGGQSFQDCGPFTNDDGLPAELVEASIE